MAKQTFVRLRSFLATYPRGLPLLLSSRENVVCSNSKTGALKRVQLRALYKNNKRFWMVEGNWDYLISEEVARAVRSKLDTSARSNPGTDDAPHDAVVETPAQDLSGDEFDATGKDTARPNRDVGLAERAGSLLYAQDRLERLADAADSEPQEVAQALVETSVDLTTANRVALLTALRLGNEQARAYTAAMVDATEKVVESTIRLVDSPVYEDELVRRLVERSNGTIVRHMTRVFLSGVEFTLYYNRQVAQQGIANRIRVSFPKKYKTYYCKLLPHLHPDQVTLEHVFYGGMRALSAVEIQHFATGFLIHDVGKADDIEYHEGEAAYDRETVVRHVKVGYRAVMEKTTYPREAGLITGYHHEYYGAPSGYGYFRDLLDAYKRLNPHVVQDYAMAYTMEPLIDYQVLSYFPAKILEIVDVFDSITDPARRYRKPFSVDEAIAFMRDDFVDTNLKLDPILFDLFAAFVAEAWTGPRE